MFAARKWGGRVCFENFENSEKGWPKRVNKLSEELQKFSQIKEEIFIADKFIFFGDRLIIPAQLRLKFLKILHKGHMGINKCRTRAQECIYWPGISRDIATLVSKCSVCNRFRKNNSKLPILQHSITNRPWEKLASDILTFKNNDYLVIVDYYSRWLELKKLKSKNISQIIKIFNKVFSVHGYPDIIVTDNVPFNSYELKSYLNERNIKLINSSPNYPRSNGLAEKAVNVAKNMLRKCDLENGDINSYLLNYRNTPSPDFGLSPAQLLLSRRLKDDIPVMDHLLQPIAINKKFIREKFENRRLKQKNYYNRHVKNLAEGKIGDRVLFKYKNVWKEGKIVNLCEEPRSYHVIDIENRIFRRTRQHIILLNNSYFKFHNDKTNEGTWKITDPENLVDINRARFSLNMCKNKHDYNLRERKKINYKE